LGPQPLQPLDGLAAPGVGPRHPVAEREEHLGDPAHAGAADAHEVDLLVPLPPGPGHGATPASRPRPARDRAGARATARRRAARSPGSSPPWGASGLWCSEMFSRRPTLAMATRSEEPPKETKGSGSPLVGRRPTTTPRLTRAWVVSIAVIPIAASAPKGPATRRAMRMPRHSSRPNRATVSTAPTKPSSSPTIAKMQSLWGPGR